MASAVFVTGIAGFIGMSVACRLIKDGINVVGLDNFNDYYDVQLKEDRVAELKRVVDATNNNSNNNNKEVFCKVIRGDLTDWSLLQLTFREYRIETVIHLAAQAGVRYSITNPQAYVQSNLVGFVNILEICRHNTLATTKHLVYASSSSVYGGNAKTPYAEEDSVDHPMSMYAATKKSNEVLAHSYSHLYNLPCTGLRFFTVYGPWGRPDMAVWSFTEKICAGKTIDLFDHGKPQRDFTYIDDIVEGIVRVSSRPPEKSTTIPNPQVVTAAAATPSATPPPVVDPGTSWAPFRIMNIGGSSPHTVTEFVSLLEQAIGKTADKRLVEAQPGDVAKTEADTTRLTSIIDFVPQVSLAEGLKKWWAWYGPYSDELKKKKENENAAAS